MQLGQVDGLVEILPEVEESCVVLAERELPFAANEVLDHLRTFTFSKSDCHVHGVLLAHVDGVEPRDRLEERDALVDACGLLVLLQLACGHAVEHGLLLLDGLNRALDPHVLCDGTRGANHGSRALRWCTEGSGWRRG